MNMFKEFVEQCITDSIEGKKKRLSRTARIRELILDEGMSLREAEAWADFHDDYKANASAR